MTLNTPERWSPKDLNEAFAGTPPVAPASVIKFLVEQGASDGAVLEIGCGYGRMLLALSQKLKTQIFGVDFSSHMIKLSKDYLTKDIQTILLKEGEGFPFEDESMSFIYSYATLIHNDKSQIHNIFRECDRILKQNGKMVHDVLNGDLKSIIDKAKKVKPEGCLFYPYSFNEIESIAMRYGFCITSTTDLFRKRIRYGFTKLDVG